MVQVKKLLLIVEDNESDRAILEECFKDDYEVISAENGQVALEHLSYYKSRISLVLLDLYMPIMDGFRLLDEMNKNPSLKLIPVIVATGDSGNGIELEALEKGASDFVTKPFDVTIIKQRVHNLIAVSEGRRIHVKAEFDPLTMLYNRETFCSKAEELIRQNDKLRYDIFRIDVDRFKVINDIFGTAEGDKVLIYIADYLRKEIIPGVTLCGRLAGDNFAVCLPHINGYEANMAKEVNEALEKYPLNIKIIAKCGFCRADADTPASLLCDRAAMAIKSIKGSYSERWAVYDESMRLSMLFEQEIINEMNDALREGQFVVYYQPKVNMIERRVVGCEALVRWNHPRKGFISPGLFIPIFEKNGFISALDFYMWEMVCRDLRDWINKGYNPCPVSVNVSRAELYDDSLIERLERLIARYGISHRLLQLEITESAYTENPEQLISMVEQLKSKGFTILMDDFGSGYSSLNTLKDVPVDVLKIDLKFLYNIDNNVKGNQILKSVVQMAKRLNLTVIAEGVETDRQVEFLKSIGCMRAQGFYYARPLPKEMLPGVLDGTFFYEVEDRDKTDRIVNVDDVMSQIYNSAGLDWYREAILKMNVVVGEYDTLTDTLLFFEKHSGENTTEELVKNEIPNFTATLESANLVHPDDAEKIRNMFTKSETANEIIRTTFINRTGSYTWMEVGARKATDTVSSQPVILVFRDITREQGTQLMMKTLSVLESNRGIDRNICEIIPLITEYLSLDSFKILIAGASSKVTCRSFSWNRGGEIEMNSFNGIKSERDPIKEEERFNEYGIAVFNRDRISNRLDSMQEILYGEKCTTCTVGLLNLINGCRGAVCYGNIAKRQWTKNECAAIGELTKCISAFIDKSFTRDMFNENKMLYDLAFKQLRVRLWQYDVMTERLYKTDTCNATWDTSYIENFPESFIEAGAVADEFIEPFRKLHDDLKKGIESSGIYAIMYSDGKFHNGRITYTLLKSNDGIPYRALGVCEDMGLY